MDIAEQMNVLVELQTVDSSIDRYRDKQEKLPAQLASARERVRHAEEALQQAKDRVKEEEMQRKRLELEVDGIRDEMDRLNKQIMQVKTNKEYQALLKEIEDHKRKIFLREDDILEIMENIEDLQAQVKRSERELDQASKDLKDQSASIQEELRQVDLAVSQDLDRRENIAARVDKQILARYERVRAGKGGIGVAMANIDEAICTMCHMDIRPQLLMELKQGNKVVCCESCNRILFARDAS